jgi:hypothetical protein
VIKLYNTLFCPFVMLRFGARKRIAWGRSNHTDPI